MAFMTTSEVIVEVDLGGLTDITSYWRAEQPYTINHGRTGDRDQVSAARLSLTLDNSDGRFTAGRAASPYYPNVKTGRRIRVGEFWVPGKNYMPNPSFESTDISLWDSNLLTSLSRSTVRAQDGTASLQVTNSIGSTTTVDADCDFAGLVIGNTYTASAYIYSPTGSGSYRLRVFNLNTFAILATGSTVSTHDAWTRVTVTFTATARYAGFEAEHLSAPAGTSIWVDAVQVEDGGSATSFDSTAAVMSWRFDGNVSAWPVDWAPVGLYAEARVSAVDLFARMESRCELRSAVTEEIIASVDPDAYYPLNETSSATGAGSIGRLASVGGLTKQQAGTGGTGQINFGSGTGPPAEQSTAVSFQDNSADGSNYLYLANLALPQAILAPANGSMVMGCWVNAGDTAPTGSNAVVMACRDGGANTLYLMVTTTNVWHLLRKSNSYGYTYQIDTVAVACDNNNHFLMVEEQDNGNGTYTATFWVDGISIGTSTQNGLPMRANTLYLGGVPADDGVRGFTGSISHAFWATNDVVTANADAIWDAGNGNLFNEQVANRVNRILTYAQNSGLELVTRVVDSTTTLVDNQQFAGQSTLSALQEVAVVEGGVVFMRGDRTLALHSRRRRWNVTGVGGAQLAADQYADLSPLADDQKLVNEVTVTRTGGASVTVRDTGSQDQYGPYKTALSGPFNMDTDARVAGESLLNMNSDPTTPRINQVTVDLLTLPTSLYTTFLNLEISSGLYLQGLPSQAWTSNADLVIEGWTETRSVSQWTMQFNTTPAEQYRVFQLDTSPYNQLDALNRFGA